MDRSILEKLAGGLLTGGMTSGDFVALAEEPTASRTPSTAELGEVTLDLAPEASTTSTASGTSTLRFPQTRTPGGTRSSPTAPPTAANSPCQCLTKPERTGNDTSSAITANFMEAQLRSERQSAPLPPVR